MIPTLQINFTNTSSHYSEDISDTQTTSLLNMLKPHIPDYSPLTEIISKISAITQKHDEKLRSLIQDLIVHLNTKQEFKIAIQLFQYSVDKSIISFFDESPRTRMPTFEAKTSSRNTAQIESHHDNDFLWLQDVLHSLIDEQDFLIQYCRIISPSHEGQVFRHLFYRLIKGDPHHQLTKILLSYGLSENIFLPKEIKFMFRKFMKNQNFLYATELLFHPHDQITQSYLCQYFVKWMNRHAYRLIPEDLSSLPQFMSKFLPRFSKAPPNVQSYLKKVFTIWMSKNAPQLLHQYPHLFYWLTSMFFSTFAQYPDQMSPLLSLIVDLEKEPTNESYLRIYNAIRADSLKHSIEQLKNIPIYIDKLKNRINIIHDRICFERQSLEYPTLHH